MQAPKAFVDICIEIIKSKKEKDLEVVAEKINILIDSEKLSAAQAGGLLEALKFRGNELSSAPQASDQLGLLNIVENYSLGATRLTKPQRGEMSCQITTKRRVRFTMAIRPK